MIPTTTNKQVVRVLLSVFFFSVFFHTAEAETTCAIEPFATNLPQGDSVTISVMTTMGNSDSALEFNLGNLPTGVTGGFSISESIQGNNASKKASLLIQTQSDAQMGSFMIPVLMRSSANSPSGVEQSICQFNLVVTKSVRTEISPAPAPTSPRMTSTVSSGALPTDVSLFNKTTTGVSTGSTTTSRAGLFKNTLTRGSQGSDVFVLQIALKVLGYFPAHVAPTGYYGAVTESAVKAYQSANHIDPVGLVGPQTRSILNK